MDKLKTIRKRAISKAFNIIQNLVDKCFHDKKIHLISGNLKKEQLKEIQRRLGFYVPEQILQAHTHLPLFIALGSQPILTFGEFMPISRRLMYYRGGFFDIDHNKNPVAGWEWNNLAEYCTKEKADLKKSHKRFNEYVDTLREQQLSRAYILGTGPSLAKAMERDWSDGYRIVCNTIVRDSDLWRHINPHFIVAGDAVYHFSHSRFAQTFRKDLALRLYETNTYFVYPARFNRIVSRELGMFADRLIPIPEDIHTKIHSDLYQHFGLPSLGNVLPLLLLPLACTLSKKVFLWGFDGRAPNDQLFWKNSTKHSYPEFLPELKENFPAFFDHFVPADNPSQYVKNVHGDVLEECLQSAEKEGWYFEMLHKSWTPTLQKRCKVSN